MAVYSLSFRIKGTAGIKEFAGPLILPALSSSRRIVTDLCTRYLEWGFTLLLSTSCTSLLPTALSFLQFISLEHIDLSNGLALCEHSLSSILFSLMSSWQKTSLVLVPIPQVEEHCKFFVILSKAFEKVLMLLPVTNCRQTKTCRVFLYRRRCE